MTLGTVTVRLRQRVTRGGLVCEWRAYVVDSTAAGEVLGANLLDGLDLYEREDAVAHLTYRLAGKCAEIMIEPDGQ